MNDTVKSIWKETFEVSWLDADIKGKAKLSSIFNYLQEVALKHAGNMGFGYNDMIKNKQIWVVVRIIIKMKKYPAWRDQVVVETWPRGVEGLWAFREYRLSDTEGNEIGGASASWLVLDMADRKPATLSEDVFHMLPYVKEESATGEVPHRINAKGEMKVCSNHKVKFSEVDFYQHVNNTRYIDWILDALYQLKINVPIERICINYMAEAKLDDEIILKYQQNGDKIIIKGETEKGNSTVFIAELN